MTSDPMGASTGRVFLNGNAASIDQFVTLADRAIGAARHRDEDVRRRDSVVICTGAWGPGERNDVGLRKALAQAGRGEGGRFVENLGVWTAMNRLLRDRPTVAVLYEEHEAIWRELVHAYTAENNATVARLRDVWVRASAADATLTMPSLLHAGNELPPGPRTRPASVFLRTAQGRQLRRALGQLHDADEHHGDALRALWAHFHAASGLEFDDGWQQARRALVKTILGAGSLLFPGGSPSLLLVGFRFFGLESVLGEALRRGTSFFATSAGAMALGRRVVVFHDKGVPRQEFQLLENGLRLVEGLQVFPHVTDRVQTDDPANLAYLAARFRYRTCVGLNAGSVLELEPSGGRWRARSVGDEDVVVFDQNGDKVRYGRGDVVAEVQ